MKKIDVVIRKKGSSFVIVRVNTCNFTVRTFYLPDKIIGGTT